RSSSALVIGVNAAALTLFAASPHAAEYPTLALGIVAFLLVQLLLPACRPVRETPLCPANIAQAFFWVQLVLVALLIGFGGIREGPLPRLPSRAAIDTAVGLRILGYLAFCVAYQVAGGPAATARRDETPSAAMPRLILVFLLLGVLGQCLAYRSLTEFVEFASSPVQQREREAEPTTPAGAASTFLPPFLRL